MDRERDYKPPTVESLEREINTLKSQLKFYFEWLEEAEEQRHAFQLKATWGIITGSCAIAAMWATNWISAKLHLSGFIGSLLGGIAFLVLLGVGTWWSESGRQDDEKKLYRLPKWATDDFLRRWNGQW